MKCIRNGFHRIAIRCATRTAFQSADGIFAEPGILGEFFLRNAGGAPKAPEQPSESIAHWTQGFRATVRLVRGLGSTRRCTVKHMIAVRVHRFGDAVELALEEMPVPEPSQGEALVRVFAAGVGPWDALIRTCNGGLAESLPLIPGSDIAGIIEKIDPSLDSMPIKTGDAIFGVTNPSFTGGYAQYAVATLNSIFHKPSTLSFIEAASVPLVAVTAWQMLFDYVKIEAGQRVLVQGAAGNVGAYAVQLACWAGACVIAVAGGADKRYVRNLGANEVIDFQSERFEDRVADVDAVIDTVGGEVQDRSFGIIKPGGILVSSASEPSPLLAAHHNVRTAYFVVHVTSKNLGRIATLIDQGVLKTDLGVVLSFDDVRMAHEMLAGTLPRPRGKIVLDLTMLKESS
jgi:NADPH:quinone reductase-like Zn-dependent oxidoreductase